jgi:hypothetical protein
MSKNPTDFFVTCDPFSVVKYVPAIGFLSQPRADTSRSIDPVRRVVTTAQDGALVLRYAPRFPRILDRNTA